MRNRFKSGKARDPRILLTSAVMLGALVLAGCAGMPFDLSSLPFQLFTPTPTFTPTPVPTDTPTPMPTPTLKPGEVAVPPTATPIPTPEVTIPQGFTPVKDDKLGYSLAVPPGWSPLDLRSAQFQNMANTFGMAGQLGPLNDFLNSPQGRSLGVIYITDIMNAMFGGLPTALNVFVIDAPGATPEWTLNLVKTNLEANKAMLGNVNITAMDTAVVNNLPAVEGSATADMSQYGLKAQIYAKVVALVANDKIYILTLATQANNQAAKDPVFNQIIGTFRPE